MLTSRDPLAKLGLALACLVEATVSQRPAALGILAGGVLVLLLGIERIAPARLARAAWPFGLFALSSAWIYAVAPSSVYAGSGEGWAVGLLVGTRTLTIGVISTAFVLTTEPADLARALVARARLPRRFVYGALAAVQFLPALSEEARLARMLARTTVHLDPRRPPGWNRFRLAWAGLAPGIGIILLAGAVRRASAAALAMDLRGLSTASGPLRWRVPRFGRGDAVFVLLAAGFAILAFLLP